MSNESGDFFVREMSFVLKHQNGESHLVVFSTQNSLALSVLAYTLGQLNESTEFSDFIDTKHFPAKTVEEARDFAVEWAKSKIDENLELISA